MKKSCHYFYSKISDKKHKSVFQSRPSACTVTKMKATQLYKTEATVKSLQVITGSIGCLLNYNLFQAAKCRQQLGGQLGKE